MKLNHSCCVVYKLSSFKLLGIKSKKSNHVRDLSSVAKRLHRQIHACHRYANKSKKGCIPNGMPIFHRYRLFLPSFHPYGML